MSAGFHRVARALRLDAEAQDHLGIAAVVIAARRHAGLIGKDLAERIGRDPSFISRLESGSKCPSLSTLYEIAKACGVAFVIDANGLDVCADAPEVSNG